MVSVNGTMKEAIGNEECFQLRASIRANKCLQLLGDIRLKVFDHVPAHADAPADCVRGHCRGDRG